MKSADKEGNLVGSHCQAQKGWRAATKASTLSDEDGDRKCMDIGSLINPVGNGTMKKDIRIGNQKQKVCRPKMPSVQKVLASGVKKHEVVSEIAQANAGISFDQLVYARGSQRSRLYSKGSFWRERS